MSYNGASTESHVVIALLLLVSVVSFALSLLVVVAIGLPLVREPEKRTPAASFNLYIVLLSLTDAVWMALLVGCSVVFYCVQWEGNESPGDITLAIAYQHVPWWITNIASHFCGPVLMWTVPLVGREILELLRNSKQRKRCKPPALRRVALHGVAACAAGIAGYVLMLLAIVLGNEWLGFAPYAIMLAPVPWTLWIVFRIFREGLMRFGAGVGNRLRVLVVYFGRIVLVYCVLVGCLVIAQVIAQITVAKDRAVVGVASVFLMGIQGWVNFAVIRTKPDVGKMIDDLVAGTACRSGGSGQTTSAEPTGRLTEPATTTQEDGGAAIRDNEAQGREGNGTNRIARRSVHELVSREFIEGIEDYLSGDEDDDDGADVAAIAGDAAGGTAVVAGAAEEAI